MVIEKRLLGGAGTYHGGIDIGAPQGTKILAIDSGTIIRASWYGADGYTVMIDHGNGYVSTYGHVNPNFIVSVGDKVEARTNNSLCWSKVCRKNILYQIYRLNR